MQIILKHGQATQKLVALELIKQLKKEGYDDILEDESDPNGIGLPDSDTDQDIAGNSSKKHHNLRRGTNKPFRNQLLSDLKDKKVEDNIGRRVYDALNVQYAANILVKDGRYFKPNYENVEFHHILKKIQAKIEHDSEQTPDSVDSQKQLILDLDDRNLPKS